MDNVTESLNRINSTLEKQTEAIKSLQPPRQGLFMRWLATAGMVAGVLGILQLVDMVVGWFGG